MTATLNPSTCYHIYNHGNGDANLFREERNYPFFLAKLREHIAPVAELVSWCLMPNHFHLVVKIWEEVEILNHPDLKNLDGLDSNNLSKRINQRFSNFFNSYTKAFNKTYGRRGSLFLKNYKRKEIDTTEYFRNLIHYVHSNPVHHGFTDSLEKWNWSSNHSFPEHSSSWLHLLFDTEANYINSLQAFIDRPSLHQFE